MADTRLSDIREETSVDLVDESEAENAKDLELDKAMKQLFKATRNGKLPAMQDIVDKHGPEVLTQRDQDGHTLAHWAALNGHVVVMEYLLANRSPENEHSDNSYGPKPIHWACVRGHITIINLLLEHDVSVEECDHNGCTPLIVAAQYGQSLVLSFLLQKGADKFHMDINKDTALHWAAYKGNPEVTLMLLSNGLDPKQKDSFGQTPVHSACITGDLSCLELLIEYGGILDDADDNRKKPIDLATGRRHRNIIQYITRQEQGITLEWQTIIFGPPGRSRWLIWFFITLMLLWAYPMYFLKCIPRTFDLLLNLHIFFMATNVLMWVFYILTLRTEPGFVNADRSGYDETIKMLSNPSAWSQYAENDVHNPLYNLCHTCKIVRPVRAKHCRQCYRCVDHFDHHCNWVDNCIGKKNRVYFALFIYLMNLNGLITVYFAYVLLQLDGFSYLVVIGLPALFFFGTPALVIIYYLTYQILSNLTTIERTAYFRYRHFRSSDGASFRNPFHRGLIRNILEFFNITTPAYMRRRPTMIV